MFVFELERIRILLTEAMDEKFQEKKGLTKCLFFMVMASQAIQLSFVAVLNYNNYRNKTFLSEN